MKNIDVLAVQKLVKRGNSVFVLLPQDVLKRFGMFEGDNVMFIETAYGLLVSKNGLANLIPVDLVSQQE